MFLFWIKNIHENTYSVTEPSFILSFKATFLLLFSALKVHYSGKKKHFCSWSVLQDFFSPQGGAIGPDFQWHHPGRVLLLSWTFSGGTECWWTKNRADRVHIPSLPPLFCLRASINFTTIQVSVGRKVRAAPTKHIGSIHPFWKLSPSSVSTKINKNNNNCRGKQRS